MKTPRRLFQIVLLLSLIVAAQALAGQPMAPFRINESLSMAKAPLSLEILSFSAQDKDGQWYWYLTFKNTDPNRSLTRGRMEIRVYQIGLPAHTQYQTSVIPFESNLGSGRSHSVSIRFNKRRDATSLRLVLFDLKNNQEVVSQKIPLEDNMGVSLQQTIPQAAQGGPGQLDVREEAAIISAKYLGMGNWEAVVKNTGTVPIEAGACKLEGRHRFFIGRASPGTSASVPRLLAGQEGKVTGGGFYGHDDCDCITLTHIDFVLKKGAAQEIISEYTLPIEVPKVTIDYVEAVAEDYDKQRDFHLYGAFTNHSDYDLNLVAKVKINFVRGETLQTLERQALVHVPRQSSEVRCEIIHKIDDYLNQATINEFINVNWQVETELVMDGDEKCVIEGVLDRHVSSLLPYYRKERD